MVCSLGFLNRSGLDQLPHIFHDYETWQDWGGANYDPDDHLVGFTLENRKRLKRFQAARERSKEGAAKLPWDGSVAQVDDELEKRKRKLFEGMSKQFAEGSPKKGRKSKIKMNLDEIAKLYRAMLAEVRRPPASAQGERRVLTHDPHRRRCR